MATDGQSEAIEVRIPGKIPSSNHIYATVQAGRKTRRVLNKKGKAYKTYVKALVADACRKAGGLRKSRWYKFTLFTYFSLITQKDEVRKRDVSDCIKLIEDATAEALRIDDKHNKRVETEKFNNDGEEYIVVKVRVYEPLVE